MKISTTFGDEIQIKEEEFQLITNNGTSISIKKIASVGDYIFENNISSHKNKMIFFFIFGLCFLFGSIYFIYNPYIVWKGLVSYDGRSLEEVSRMPDIFTWSFTLICFFIAQIENVKIKRINNIDYEKNNLILTTNVLIKDSTVQKEKIYKIIEICKGNFNELSEIREKIISIKSKSELL